MKIIKDIKKVLTSRKEIVIAYLYGSFAKGKTSKASDIDIGILLKKSFRKDVFYEGELALEIEKKTKLKNIEVVVLNNKPVRFLNQVLRYGKLILSKDEKYRINFETFVTKSYIDFKPHYKLYDDLRLKRL